MTSATSRSRSPVCWSSCRSSPVCRAAPASNARTSTTPSSWLALAVLGRRRLHQSRGRDTPSANHARPRRGPRLVAPAPTTLVSHSPSIVAVRSSRRSSPWSSCWSSWLVGLHAHRGLPTARFRSACSVGASRTWSTGSPPRPHQVTDFIARGLVSRLQPGRRRDHRGLRHLARVALLRGREVGGAMSDDAASTPSTARPSTSSCPRTLDAIRVDRVLSMLTGLSRSEASDHGRERRR